MQPELIQLPPPVPRARPEAPLGAPRDEGRGEVREEVEEREGVQGADLGRVCGARVRMSGCMRCEGRREGVPGSMPKLLPMAMATRTRRITSRSASGVEPGIR